MYIALNGWVWCGFANAKKPLDFINWAAEQKLDGVELTVGDCLPIETTEAEARALAAEAKAKGVGLRSLATGAGWVNWLCADDPAERARAITFVRQYLQLAKWIGAETVLVVPGATRVAWDAAHAEVSYAQAWANATLSLRELVPEAERLGVNLALENVWNRFLLSPMEWKFFLDQFDSPRLGIYLDVANCCYFARPEDYIEILGTRIKGVHLKNFTGSDAAGGLHGFGENILTGDVDFVKVFRALARVGYTGPCSVEMIPFSRLPNMVLPDEKLAEQMVLQIKTLQKLAF